MISVLVASAHAGGYYYSDAGIVATGRGGAWIAGADTQFAQYYNPAGLIRIESPTVNVGLSQIQQEVRFTRLAEDGETFLPEVRNQASPFDIPELGFATPLGDRLVLAVGFYSPFAPSSLYDEEGPQRYSVKDTTIYQFSIGPSLAFRLHPTLTLGLGLQWQYLQIGETLDITLTGRDDPTGDVAVEARASDPFTPNANLGLLFEPIPPLSIGLSVQPPTAFAARGTGSLDFEGNAFAALLDETSYRDDDIGLRIDLPWVIRAGVAVRPIERLEIEGAVVWQGWSSLEEILIEDIDVAVESSILPEEQRQIDDRISLPAGLDDTVSLRLGVEGDVHRRVALRAGGFWEGSALSPEEVSVALVDTPKIQLGAGASVEAIPGRLRFDAAFAWLFFQSLEIRDSTVTQIDAGVLDSAQPVAVGNGDLASHGWVLGLAGQLSFPQKGAR